MFLSYLNYKLGIINEIIKRISIHFFILLHAYTYFNKTIIML